MSRSDLEVQKKLGLQVHYESIAEYENLFGHMKIRKAASKIMSVLELVVHTTDLTFTKDCPFFLLAHPEGIPVEEAPLPGGLLYMSGKLQRTC